MKILITILLFVATNVYAQEKKAVSTEDLPIVTIEVLKEEVLQESEVKEASSETKAELPTPQEVVVEQKEESSFKSKWDSMNEDERGRYLNAAPPPLEEAAGKAQLSEEGLKQLYQLSDDGWKKYKSLSLEEQHLFDKKMKFMTLREREIYLKHFDKNN